MDKYDLILVGSGFAATFFLLKYLGKNRNARVLMLERGRNDTHQWRIDHREQMDPSGVVSSENYNDTYINETPEKPWVYTPSLGGGSNCWWACTPRFMPNDFKIYSKYGVGTDWPISYDDLEPYYCEAESIMNISGSHESTPFPMSRPYPQPPHKFNEVDKLLKKKYPNMFYHMPTARPSRNTNNRLACCASGVCNLCPIDSKFTILNELSHLFNDKRVRVELGSQVLSVIIENNLAKGVTYIKDSIEHEVYGDMVALGANSLFNAHILASSGQIHPLLGKFLSEQVAFSCRVNLDGVNNFTGSTSLTGHGYMLYDGDHRRNHAACLIETFNIPKIRLEKGKYTQVAHYKFIFDDVPMLANQVNLSNDSRKPKVIYNGHSSYVDRAIQNAKNNIYSLFDCLPVESIEYSAGVHRTEAHILGTALMGDDPKGSVVNKFQALHNVSNLLSLGGSSFASISPANPTLTIAALSLWSADHIN